jgi:hypothetical protein
MAEQTVRARKIAALTVGGSEGTPWGYAVPTALRQATPPRNKLFSQIFAEKIKDVE